MSVEDKLSKLQRRQSIAVGAFGAIAVCLSGVVAYQGYELHRLTTSKSMRLRELRLYDEKGVDRVVIAGRLPQPVIDGKPYGTGKREMAGVLIYDASGTERGGYGTTNGYANAMLTLDAKTHQVMLLLAEPDGGPFFRQWDGKGSVTMGVSEKPFLTLKDDKTVIFAKPEDNPWVSRGLK